MSSIGCLGRLVLDDSIVTLSTLMMRLSRERCTNTQEGARSCPTTAARSVSTFSGSETSATPFTYILSRHSSNNMLVPRGPEAGKEEHLPCHYCSSIARLGYDEHGYTAFTDQDPRSLSRGQVWSIRESLMLPIAEFLEKSDRKLVYDDLCSGKSRPPTISSWLAKFRVCKEGPRPCIIHSSGLTRRTWLMGTFNNGHFSNLSLCVDMFFVQVDPATEDITPSEQHVHATPRWCQRKKQYVCVLTSNHLGRLPEGRADNQGYILDRWAEQNGTEQGQHYGLSEKQLNRLNMLGSARASQWRKCDKDHKRVAIRQFRVSSH